MKIPDHAIAPGLEVAALVEYYTTKTEDAQDRVILLVDNDVVEIPLIASVKNLVIYFTATLLSLQILKL